MLNRIVDQDRQMVMDLRDHLAQMFQSGGQNQQSEGQQASAPH